MGHRGTGILEDRGWEGCGHAGFTLLEIVVTLALLGLILGVSAVAMASLREPSGARANRQWTAARDSAIRSGEPVIVPVTSLDTAMDHSPLPTHLLFLPDGTGIGAGVDRLTGESDAGP